jgi:2-oxoglutarate/2-oxoacid ferredoxin oxidoreductase subunit alpha
MLENLNINWRLGLMSSEISKKERFFIRGVDAVALGKLKAGCRFQTYYPITPATDESEVLEALSPIYGNRVYQTEDEIAAICAAVGAAEAGVRSSTSTSGPGLCLMVEGFGWASKNESAGFVLTHYQRAGPSTGMPTKTEQGDLKFVLNMAHGDSPRMIVAPGDHIECFYDTFDSFNYSERYQVPVILLIDKNIASNKIVIDGMFDETNLKIDRGKLLNDEELKKIIEEKGSYKRFSLDYEDGISPRTVLGQKRGRYWKTGDESDELGHITEDPEVRVKMMDKRMKKLVTAYKEIPLDKKIRLYGPEDAKISIVSWGSTKGAIIDAMRELNWKLYDKSINFLQIKLLEPFPTEDIKKRLEGKEKIVVVEMNYLSEDLRNIGYTSQMGGILKMRTGIESTNYVVKYNGRPFTRNEIKDSLDYVLTKDKKVVVMTRGI